MKRILFAGAIALTAVGPALAADLPVAPPPPPAAPAYVPPIVYNWGGCYVGLNAGGMWESDSTSIGLSDPTGTATPAYAAGAIPSSFSYTRDGWLAGGQAGCNFQTGIWVFGVETDFDGTGLSGGETINTAVPGFFPITSSVTQKMDWFGTTRGRVGVAWDNVLFYGTAGAAYGQVADTYSLSNIAGGGPVSTFGSDSTTLFGWTAGAGVEVGFGPWSVRGEALYYDLGNHSLSVPCTIASGAACATPDAVFTARYQNAGVLARAGVNYRFSW